MKTRPTVYLPNIAELFRVRDAVLSSWENGRIDPDESEARLRSMAVVDASGDTWRLRPTPQGSVLVKVSPTGDVSMPLPEDFIAPKQKSKTGTIFMVSGALLWVIVAYTWLRGG